MTDGIIVRHISTGLQKVSSIDLGALLDVGSLSKRLLSPHHFFPESQMWKAEENIVGNIVGEAAGICYRGIWHLQWGVLLAGNLALYRVPTYCQSVSIVIVTIIVTVIVIAWDYPTNYHTGGLMLSAMWGTKQD